MTGPHRPPVDAGGWAGHCPVSGKRRFWSRKNARRAARIVDKSMAAYACDHCSAFHIGHLPPQVVRGDATRDDITEGRLWRRTGT